MGCRRPPPRLMAARAVDVRIGAVVDGTTTNPLAEDGIVDVARRAVRTVVSAEVVIDETIASVCCV